MSAQDRYIYVPIVLAFLFVMSAACFSFADEPAVQFDAPALVAVHELEIAKGHQSSTQKIIEIAIPVSSEISTHNRNNIDEFRFDVYWNRNVYPLVDYAPKTQTVSDIEGLISVEKNTDRNSGLGINLNSSYLDAVSGSVKLDLSKKTGTRLKYQEIPLHEVLVASGTIQRGTGAFFRFHPSKRNTLEGGRDLIVAFRVPHVWRAGVIKVECRASGHRKIVGSWREPLEENQAFVIPVYLKGDDQARQAAEDFVRSEQGLRQNWQRHQGRSAKKSGGFLSLVSPTSSGSKQLPAHWVHHLIQSGGDEYLKRYRSRLTAELADAADKFVLARRDLFEFSR